MNGRWTFPFWIAHRGAGRLAPENTLAALRAGAAQGYRAFECDVKLSADGHPFLLHDTTLQRTCGVAGIAGERSWAELSRLDAGGWHGRNHAGEPIPHLDAIARYCRRNGFALNIEIKPTPGRESDTGRAVAEAARRLWGADAGDGAQLLLSSFRAEALAAARDADPAIPRALLFDHDGDAGAGIARVIGEARALGAVAVVGDYASLGQAAIAQAHAAGLRVLAYTVNDPAPARQLAAAGIDGLITDAVDRFAPGVAMPD